MSSSRPFSERMTSFKNKFKAIVGVKPTGYDELSILEQPLVGRDDSTPDRNDAYFRTHGVPRPGQDHPRARAGAGGGDGGEAPRVARAVVPTQVLIIPFFLLCKTPYPQA